MRLFTILTIVFATIAMSVSANADKKTKQSDDYYSLLKQHPEYIAVLNEADSYNETANSAMGLPDPNLILGVDNVPVSDQKFDRFLPTSKVIGFNQKFPSWGSRDANFDKFKNISAKTNLKANYILEQLEAEFKSAINNKSKIISLQKIYKEKKKLLNDIQKFYSGEVESGRSVYGRLSKIDVEKADIEQRLNNLEYQLEDIDNSLISLTGKTAKAFKTEVKLEEWNKEKQNLYPIKISEFDINSADKEIEASESLLNPAFGVNALYKQREDGRNFVGDDWFSVQAQISIPLWASDNQLPKIRAARSSKESAKRSYENVKRMWQRRISSMLKLITTTSDNLGVLKKKLSSFKDYQNSIQRKYEAGDSDLGSVLEARLGMLDIKVQIEEREAEYANLVADFNSHIIGGENE